MHVSKTTLLSPHHYHPKPDLPSVSNQGTIILINSKPQPLDYTWSLTLYIQSVARFPLKLSYVPILYSFYY